MTRYLTTRLFRRAAVLPAALLWAPAVASAQVVASAAPSPATSTARRAAAPADTAIQQLESFLQRYPSSPLRPNALFQLGELLVRRADERFNEQQRAGATAAAATDSSSAARASAAGGGSSTASRPDYGPAIARYEELVQRFPNF